MCFFRIKFDYFNISYFKIKYIFEKQLLFITSSFRLTPKRLSFYKIDVYLLHKNKEIFQLTLFTNFNVKKKHNCKVYLVSLKIFYQPKV